MFLFKNNSEKNILFFYYIYIYILIIYKGENRKHGEDSAESKH